MRIVSYTLLGGAVIPGLALAAAGCSENLDGPAPSLSSAEPSLVCTEQITTPVTLSGSDLAPTVFDSLTEDEQAVLPQIDLTQTSDLSGDDVSGSPVRVPDDEAGGHVRWTSSSEMQFDVTPELGLEPGVYDVTVTNPSNRSDTLTGAFGAVPRPVIDEIVPEAMCVAQGMQSFEIRGSGFLATGAGEPSVQVGDKTYAPSAIEMCSELAVPADGVESCKVVVVTVPQGDLEPGTYDVVLTNPEPAECASSDEAQLEIAPPPEVESVDPLTLCRGGGTLSIQGMNFAEGATVSLDGLEAATTTFVSDSELTAQFGAIGEPGPRTLSVDNNNGCTADFDTQIEIVDGIVVFFADPPVVYNGIDTRITIFVSGLDQPPTRVALLPPDDGREPIDLTASVIFEQDQAGRVQAVVPSGLDPGQYGVVVEDGTGCETILPAGLTVTDELTLALEAISPPFAEEGEDTGVELRAADDPADGEVQFVQTPRAYLNPADDSSAAQELEAVSFESATRVTGIVPDDTPAGTYDVIAVNPTGEVGLIEDAFEVTADPPPVVDAVSPGSLVDSTDPQPATVIGDSYRNPEVAFTCILADGVTERTPAVTVDAVRTDPDLQDEIDISVDTEPLEQGTVCVVRVTNEDGTFVDFSAVNITNPASAQNALAFDAATNLGTPRRFPAATGGRVSGTARFVYAIGGDDGSLGGAHDTVEAASVGLFGDLGPWFEVPVPLPSGRTFARAVTVADDFIYLVGGFDPALNGGSGATTGATLRAKVLDPKDRPELNDLNLTLADQGLAPGVYFYRLSVVVAGGSPQDPGGGEILASDPLAVQVPEIDSGEEVQVTLLWPEVPEAVEYRLYRTPEPDLASGDERLLASLDPAAADFEPRLVDDGSVTPSGLAPLPLGSTGAWHDAGALGTPRQAHGLTVAPDPNTPGVFHIYAIAGDDGGADLGSVERLTVTVDAEGDQAVGAWQAESALPAGTERRNLEALTADGITASKVGEQVFLYALGGTSGADGTVSSVHAVEVGADGTLGAWQAVASMQPARAGYGAALANNFLYAFGDLAGNANTGSKAQICGEGDIGDCSGKTPPEVDKWTSLSESLNFAPRALMGKAIQSSFVYVIGGIDPTDADAVLGTTAQSVLGGQP